LNTLEEFVESRVNFIEIQLGFGIEVMKPRGHPT